MKRSTRFSNDGPNLDVQVDHVAAGGQIVEAEAQAVNTGVWQGGSCGGAYSEYLHCGGQIDFGVVLEGAPLTVRARGTSGSEQLQLVLDGEVVQTFALSTSLEDYQYTGEIAGKPVQLHFSNDGDWRDVQIDALTFGGVTHQAEDQAINTGVWQDGSYGGSYSEYLHCGGYVDFGVLWRRPDP
ncbi:MAG: carbohydrate-binding domain-containing protein [Myxococcota bacterium]